MVQQAISFGHAICHILLVLEILLTPDKQEENADS